MERVHGSKDSHTHVLGGVMCGPGPCLLHVGGLWVTSPTNSTLTHTPKQAHRCLSSAAAAWPPPLNIFFLGFARPLKHRNIKVPIYICQPGRITEQLDGVIGGNMLSRHHISVLLVTLRLVKTSLELELVRIELLRVFVCVFFYYYPTPHTPQPSLCRHVKPTLDVIPFTQSELLLQTCSWFPPRQRRWRRRDQSRKRSSVWNKGPRQHHRILSLFSL